MQHGIEWALGGLATCSRAYQSEMGRRVGNPGDIFATVALLEVMIGMRSSGKYRS